MSGELAVPVVSSWSFKVPVSNVCVQFAGSWTLRVLTRQSQSLLPSRMLVASCLLTRVMAYTYMESHNFAIKKESSLCGNRLDSWGISFRAVLNRMGRDGKRLPVRLLLHGGYPGVC